MILQDACRAEATLESTFVRLAAERQLSQAEVESLGGFRQIFQHLRESIRDGVPLSWNNSEHPAYAEFKLSHYTRSTAICDPTVTSSPKTRKPPNGQIRCNSLNLFTEILVAGAQLPQFTGRGNGVGSNGKPTMSTKTQSRSARQGRYPL